MSVQELEATGASAPEVPAVLHVSVSAEPDERVWVVYGEDALTQRTAAQPGATLVPVIGLKAGRTVRWQAVARAPDGGERRSGEQTFTVPELPAGIPSAQVQGAPTEPGYVLTSLVHADPPLVGILDHEGDWVWWVPLSLPRVPTTRLSADGAAVLVAEFAEEGTTQQHSDLLRIALDGTSVQRTRLERGHHDFVEIEPGRVAYLTLTTQARPELGLAHPVATDGIQLGDEPVMAALTDRLLPGPPFCSHQRTAREKFGQTVFELTHSNSLVWVQSERAFYVLSKFTDWLVKVSEAGDVQWQLSGPGGDFTDPEGRALWTDHAEEPLFSHGHLSDVWSGGALVFDNGDHRTPRHSRILELAIDEDARTVDVAWTYPHPDGGFTPTMGDAKRLPGGSVLTAWSTLGEIREVDREGTTRWRMTLPGANVGRVTWITDLLAPLAR